MKSKWCRMVVVALSCVALGSMTGCEAEEWARKYCEGVECSLEDVSTSDLFQELADRGVDEWF